MLITMAPPNMQFGGTCWCGESEEAVVAAEAGSGKLGSELRHGTGKPVIALYKGEGDDAVVKEFRMLKQLTQT